MASIVKVTFADESGKSKHRTIIKDANASLVWSSDTQVCFKITDYTANSQYEITFPRSMLEKAL